MPHAALFLAGKVFQRFRARGRGAGRDVAGFLHRGACGGGGGGLVDAECWAVSDLFSDDLVGSAGGLEAGEGEVNGALVGFRHGVGGHGALGGGGWGMTQVVVPEGQGGLGGAPSGYARNARGRGGWSKGWGLGAARVARQGASRDAGLPIETG